MLTPEHGQSPVSGSGQQEPSRALGWTITTLPFASLTREKTPQGSGGCSGGSEMPSQAW